MGPRERVLGECVGPGGDAEEGSVGVASGALSYQVAVVSITRGGLGVGPDSVCWGEGKMGSALYPRERLARMGLKEKPIWCGNTRRRFVGWRWRMLWKERWRAKEKTGEGQGPSGGGRRVPSVWGGDRIGEARLRAV